MEAVGLAIVLSDIETISIALLCIAYFNLLHHQIILPTSEAYQPLYEADVIDVFGVPRAGVPTLIYVIGNIIQSYAEKEEESTENEY